METPLQKACLQEISKRPFWTALKEALLQEKPNAVEDEPRKKATEKKRSKRKGTLSLLA
jgi:hypothetical protein